MRNPLCFVWQFPRRFLGVILLLFFVPRRSLIALIMLYQATFSPDHGPLKSLFPYGYCRHSPTCSEYGVRVIGRWGTIIGGLLTIRRVLSCHPWAPVSDERMRSAIDIDRKRAMISPPHDPSHHSVPLQNDQHIQDGLK